MRNSCVRHASLKATSPSAKRVIAGIPKGSFHIVDKKAQLKAT